MQSSLFASAFGPPYSYLHVMEWGAILLHNRWNRNRSDDCDRVVQRETLHRRKKEEFAGFR